MVISGEWATDDDGIVRPMIDVHFDLADGTRDVESFVVDTGADCTLFTDRLAGKLGGPVVAGGRLVGAGGSAPLTAITATIILETVDRRDVTIQGNFACAAADHLDVNLLGRDVLANFDVIVSRRRNEVLLVAGNHSYAVTG